MDETSRCPFCDRALKAESSGRDSLVVSLPDSYPVSEGHMLIVPLAHEADVLKLDTETQSAMWALAIKTAQKQVEAPGVTGCNIGINVGRTAGQTVDHAHLHVIPRRDGDTADPRGGVRWVIPETADYWSRD